ncbi:MAG: SH3 domain-containing protein [Saccharofermentans sp.]|nr:SH3 domain-containing protein [Saccharofermentans sp.]
MAFSLAACKKKTDPSASDASAIASSNASSMTTTTIPTTTLTEYSGPVPNSQQVTWEETALEAEATYYATVTAGEFLNVRKGPGTEYDKVGTLTRGQAVTVVARTSNGWYKTADGYYVSETYLATTAPTA